MGDTLGKGTNIELAMDLDSGKGHLEFGGNGANVITGKLKAIAGLFRKDRKSTKSSQSRLDHLGHRGGQHDHGQPGEGREGGLAREACARAPGSARTSSL